MNPVICLAAVLIFFHAIQLCTAGPACPDCGPPLHVKYNERKSTIFTLLAQTETGTVITDSLGDLKNEKVSDLNDQKTLESVIAEVEDGIMKNDSYSDEQKLRRIALKLDQFFLNYPAIEDAIRYEQIGSWGPLCDFCYMVDEMNIESFWEIVSTPGKATSCLLHDLILDAAKDNFIIQRDLYLKNCPCSKSAAMVSDVVKIDQDTPNPKDQLVLKSLELAGYDITVNQIQRVARSYYTTKSPSCRRIRDTFANYKASQFKRSETMPLQKIDEEARVVLSAQNGPTTYFCVQWYSEQMANEISTDPHILKIFNLMFWNLPYGSMYDNIISNDCQISVLKDNAPFFYS